MALADCANSHVLDNQPTADEQEAELAAVLLLELACIVAIVWSTDHQGRVGTLVLEVEVLEELDHGVVGSKAVTAE